MPKRRSETSNGSFKRAKIEEVIVKSEIIDSSDYSEKSSTSTSSVDSETMNKVIKKYKKKMSSGGSPKRYYRMFKRDMELFQRNIDVKLKYIENLLQDVIRNQQQPAKDSPEPAKVSSRHILIKRSKPSSKRNNSVKLQDSVYSAYNLPKFPIQDSEALEQFDHDIALDDELRTIVIEKLHPHAIFGHTRTHSSRVSYLLNYMFPRSLLSQYTFSGRKKLVEERQAQDNRRAFGEFNGIIGIIKATINHKLVPEEELTSEEIIKAVSSSLKRAWNNRKQLQTPVYVHDIPNFTKPQLEVLDPDNDEEY
jgi:Domain of unknown function (DUF4806)